MALDEPKDTDDVYDIKGHKIVVDKEFMKQAQSIKVDFSGMGFKIDSKIDFGQSSCSSCGTEGSCCS
jgi:Fe-S cluster assembly iron-binding protein IscA